MDLDLLVRAPRAIVDGREVARSIGVHAGRIVAVDALEADLTAARVLMLGEDEVLLPGLVDTHVHVNEPGRSEWEGFDTATRSAAAGGFTTIIDMPLNSIPPTCTVEALSLKRAAAFGRCHVDVGFWGGAVPGNVDQLRAMHEAGTFGFKCFMVDSGVPEFGALNRDQLGAALREIACFDGLLIAHAEDETCIQAAPKVAGRRYDSYLASRPPAAENRAIAELIELSREVGARVHVVHLSSAEAVPLIDRAQRDGVRVSVETCPHYLSFAAEEIPDGATAFKCSPPIRAAGNRELLWQALREHVITSVASDHSPCTPELKHLDTGDFATSWGGIASLQLALPAVWTQARLREFSLADVVSWMSSGSASLIGLPNKGALAIGFHADFCVFAPDEEFVVDPNELHHRNPVTPYSGRRLSGVVLSTWLHGQQICERNEINLAPSGILLSRGVG